MDAAKKEAFLERERNANRELCGICRLCESLSSVFKEKN